MIANTIKAELPEGFQRAEFLMDHGFIDMIVHRVRRGVKMEMFQDLYEKQAEQKSEPIEGEE